MTIEKVLLFIGICFIGEIILSIASIKSSKKRKISNNHTILALIYKTFCLAITSIIITYLFKQSVLLGSLGILLLLTTTHAYVTLGIIIAIPVNGYRTYKLWKATAYLRSIKKFCKEQDDKPYKPEPYYSKSQQEWVERELEALKKRQEQEGA